MTRPDSPQRGKTLKTHFLVETSYEMGKWKPVPIDSDAVIQDIDGLIGIEVLEPDDAFVVKGKVRLG